MELFHRSFLKIMDGGDELEDNYDPNTIQFGDEYDSPKTSEAIADIAPKLLQGVKREQRLIKTTPLYYVAQDIKTNTVYICYRDVLHIDIDYKSYPELRDDDVISHFNDIPNRTFRIYKSYGGYHVFCTSHRFQYRDLQTVEFMLNNMCDFYYAAYCYIRGFSVRLSKKFFEDPSTPTYKFLCDVGDAQLVNDDIVKLVDLQYSLSKQYSGVLSLNV
jgi:hypothetical protein